MALQICPNCRAKKFTWSIDEEESPLTKWRCWKCRYTAMEDETEATLCQKCGQVSYFLTDANQFKYHWCLRCDYFTLVDNKV